MGNAWRSICRGGFGLTPGATPRMAAAIALLTVGESSLQMNADLTLKRFGRAALGIVIAGAAYLPDAATMRNRNRLLLQLVDKLLLGGERVAAKI